MYKVIVNNEVIFSGNFYECVEYVESQGLDSAQITNRWGKGKWNL